jgi:GT2 family glycosyltransferase
MNLSIIIVSWNTCQFLHQCLHSIYSHPPNCLFDVWVVDNASTDGTPAMLHEFFPQVRLILNHNNGGFAQANNQAILQSQSRYVLLLNPDTVVEPGALEKLVSYMDEHPRVGGAGPRMLNPDGSLQQSCYPTPTLMREFLRLFHLDSFWPRAKCTMERWSVKVSSQVEIIQGACLILRRSALEQVGCLDERFYIYSEDYDLCYRLRRGGWRLSWLPVAEVIHYGGQSTTQVKAEMFIQLYEAKLQFMRKHYGWLGASTYKLILFSSAMPRLVLILLSHFEEDPESGWFRAVGDNYRRLINALPGM